MEKKIKIILVFIWLVFTGWLVFRNFDKQVVKPVQPTCPIVIPIDYKITGLPPGKYVVIWIDTANRPFYRYMNEFPLRFDIEPGCIRFSSNVLPGDIKTNHIGRPF